MNHIYGVNKYTYARYCTETDIFFLKIPELDPDPDLVMNFPDPAKGPDPTGSGFGSATLLLVPGPGARYQGLC
jgi:hypothetical protein